MYTTSTEKKIFFAAVFSATIALLPLIYLSVRIYSMGVVEFTETVFRERVFMLTLNTLALTLTVAVTCFIVGAVVGVSLAKFSLPGKKAILLTVTLPLAVPSYLAAYGWLVILPSMHGFVASWIVMTAVCIPYVALPVSVAAKNIHGDAESLARTLGCSALSAFMRVSWPQLRGVAGAGSILVALYTLSDFGAVSMLKYQTLTWGIKSAYASSFNRNQAAVLAFVLVLLALILVVLERRSRPPGAINVRRSLQPRQLSSAMSVFIIVFCLLSPVIGALIPLSGVFMQLFRVETLQLIDLTDLGVATLNSVSLAVTGSLATVLIALPIALLATRKSHALVRAIETAGYLGSGLPGIVVGLSLVFFSLQVLPALYQTIFLLILAYVVLFLSKSIAASRSGFASVPLELVDVSRTLGFSASRSWWKVTLRLAAPAIFVGALLVAIAILKELPATLLLGPAGLSTLAGELWHRTSVMQYGNAAPYAAMLVLVAALPAYLLAGIRQIPKGAS